MRRPATTWLAALSLASVSAAAAADFELVLVDQSGPVDPWGKAIGDLDGDGLPELLVAGNGGDLVAYHPPDFAIETIVDGGSFSTDLEVAQVDGSGGPDLVVVAAGELRWYEAPGWTPHPIDGRTLHDVEVADFDHDGDVDLVARNQDASGDALHFYRQDAPNVWVHSSIAVPAGEGLTTADVDRDGYVDVIINAIWYENPGSLPPAGTWMAHVYSTTWTWNASFVAVGDINGDGRVDVVLSPSESAGGTYRISWFEAPVDPTQAWAEHPIADPVESVHHFVGAADLDNDGDLDLAAAEMHPGSDPDEVKVYWNAGSGSGWQKQVLSANGSHSMRLADVDGDGDVDLFGANWSGTSQPVELWRNLAAVFRDGFESGQTDRWSLSAP